MEVSVESGEASALACINDLTDATALAFALALSTTAAATGKLTPGIYLVFLDGLDATRNVVLRTAPSSSSPTATTPDTSGQNTAIFPGSSVERVRVRTDRPYVVAKLSAGTGTLYLVPLTLV
ncbi:MAG: hypothetical protein HY909_31600 [Deltaproteobacteria bacterium]|nr:hypothetical protein [Deltaproteobacteria bacterium]